MLVKGDIKDRLIFYDHFQALFDDLNIGVFTVDSKRRITSFNRWVEALTGYKGEDVIGKYCYQIFRNDLCKGECKFHEAVVAEQTSLSFDVEILDLNNEKRLITKVVTPLFDEDKKPVGCIEIFQDHSAFEDLLNRIRYDERRLKIILDNLDIGVFTITRGGHITFFNTLAESISGYSREEILGKPCSIIFGGDASDGVTFLLQSVADGKPRSDRRLLLKTKGGQSVPIQANCMALRSDRGSIVGGLATIQDLSLIQQLNREISKSYTFGDMIGKNPSMQKIFEIASIVAPSHATILIEGPTGTGKDLLAKVIHNSSKRAKKSFIKVNCAALPDNLLESEMFGYVKGAFTGADRDKPGRFQEADGGTIFLDEIGDLPLSLQAKLLRVLEDKDFYPLGSRKTTHVDVRILAATNQGLEKLVGESRFREDLFYRLNVIRLELPPLKERKGDLPLLIDHFMKKLRVVRETRANRISEEAMSILLNYYYPGNIRELENIIEHALIICQDEVIAPRHLPLFFQKPNTPPELPESSEMDLSSTLQDSERHRIYEMLKRHNWNRGKTARELNINRTTLWRKIKKYHITPP
ncbi:sigma 54-interacting transcriptional regulator [Thermodesulfobacteriota bacterium]